MSKTQNKTEVVTGEDNVIDELNNADLPIEDLGSIDDDFAGLPKEPQKKSLVEKAVDIVSKALSHSKAKVEESEKIFDTEGNEIDPENLVELCGPLGYEDFVRILKENNHIAQVDENGIWDGPKDAVAFLGYPWIRSRRIEDSEGRLIRLEYWIDTMPFPFIELFYDASTQCFACVRADFYRKSE